MAFDRRQKAKAEANTVDYNCQFELEESIKIEKKWVIILLHMQICGVIRFIQHNKISFPFIYSINM